jgi:hypothetical protein
MYKNCSNSKFWIHEICGNSKSRIHESCSNSKSRIHEGCDNSKSWIHEGCDNSLSQIHEIGSNSKSLIHNSKSRIHNNGSNYKSTACWIALEISKENSPKSITFLESSFRKNADGNQPLSESEKFANIGLFSPFSQRSTSQIYFLRVRTLKTRLNYITVKKSSN